MPVSDQGRAKLVAVSVVRSVGQPPLSPGSHPSDYGGGNAESTLRPTVEQVRPVAWLLRSKSEDTGDMTTRIRVAAALVPALVVAGILLWIGVANSGSVSGCPAPTPMDLT
jgi:hypothetical protein